MTPVDGLDPVRIGIVSISDRASTGVYEDKGLPALKDWLGSPGVAITLLVLLSALFYHARLGLQVVIEDYVHCACKKTVLIIFITILFPVLTLISWMSVLKIHFWTI